MTRTRSFVEAVAVLLPFVGYSAEAIHLTGRGAEAIALATIALKRTADRGTNLPSMTSTLKHEAQQAPVSGRLTCSR